MRLKTVTVVMDVDLDIYMTDGAKVALGLLERLSPAERLQFLRDCPSEERADKFVRAALIGFHIIASLST